MRNYFRSDVGMCKLFFCWVWPYIRLLQNNTARGLYFLKPIELVKSGHETHYIKERLSNQFN